MIGPAIGGIAAAITNQPTVVFWVAGLMIVVSAIVVAARVPDMAHRPATAAAGETRRRTTTGASSPGASSTAC